MLTKTEEQGKFKDLPILEVTPTNFIVPKGEERMYHCRIEVKKFNAETGERLSQPRIQVFGKKFFETFGLHNLRKQGYTVDILHDPNTWLEANKELLAKIAKEKEAERLKNIEEAKKAEKEAMKAEILKELKEQGVIPQERKRKNND